MDISDTLAAVSDQLDAVDLTGGPQVFTITEVTRGNDEQPLNIRLAEFPRVWRPSKGMRRVLADNWGKDTTVWLGRQVELCYDPDVYFGKDRTGGTRIKRMSHISKPNTTRVNPRGGKHASHTVQPLPQTADTKPATKTESPLLAALNSVPDVKTDAERLEFVSLAAGRTIAAPTEITEADSAAVIQAATEGATLDELRAASGAGEGESS